MMSEAIRSLSRARRIGICGSFKATDSYNKIFCHHLGAALAKQGVTLVTAGAISRKPSIQMVDGAVIEGAKKVLDSSDKQLESIETVLSEADKDHFEVGKVNRVRGKTKEARRFRMVSSLDGFIGVGGRDGALQQLTLALAIEKPILPVPCFGGTSAQVYKDHSDELRRRLQIDKFMEERWKKRPTNEDEAAKLSYEMAEKFLSSLPYRCFVIMPFDKSYDGIYDDIIDKAVNSFEDKVLRLDRMGIPGDVLSQINDFIKHSDYVIAVLDGGRHNVYYELGLAEAFCKPSILINHISTFSEEKAPFDISTRQRIEYEKIDDNLLNKLCQSIKNVHELVTS
jgi:hypothetical protein